MPRKKTEKKEETKEEKPEKEGIKKEAKQKEIKTEKPKEEKGKIEEKEGNVERTAGSSKEEKKEDLLVPLEEYVKSGIHLGTKVITADMRGYVFRRRADGLSIFNTNIIDKKLRAAVSLLANYAPEEIIAVGKRQASWAALNALNEATGIRVFTKKYPSGIITNPDLQEFFEPKLVLVIDPWLDKNPIKDALLINLPIVALCDTNNLLSNADLIIPCNNKSNKSLGLIFSILASEYNKARKIDREIPPLAEFIGE